MQEINPLYTKYCTKGKHWVPFSEFSLNRRAKDGLTVWCKKCASIHTRKVRTPEVRRKYQLRASYNISQKKYEKMLLEQNGVCYICKQLEIAKSSTGIIKPLAIDHNHKTGELRMLLCHNCNQILGFVEINIDRLEDFLEYLEEMRNREPEVKIVQISLFDE